MDWPASVTAVCLGPAAPVWAGSARPGRAGSAPVASRGARAADFLAAVGSAAG